MPRGPSLGFNKHLTPSPELAAVIGPEPRARTRVVQDVWAYIKAELLQDRDDARVIKADDKLRAVIGERCTMFELSKHLNTHLKDKP